jgi:hypothetical protein
MLIMMVVKMQDGKRPTYLSRPLVCLLAVRDPIRSNLEYFERLVLTPDQSRLAVNLNENAPVNCLGASNNGCVLIIIRSGKMITHRSSWPR